MQSLSIVQDDVALHQRAIEKLSQEVDQPVAQVRAVFENEYALLMSRATITNFVGVFASRRARGTLLRKHA